MGVGSLFSSVLQVLHEGTSLPIFALSSALFVGSLTCLALIQARLAMCAEKMRAFKGSKGVEAQKQVALAVGAGLVVFAAIMYTHREAMFGAAVVLFIPIFWVSGVNDSDQHHHLTSCTEIGLEAGQGLLTHPKEPQCSTHSADLPRCAQRQIIKGLASGSIPARPGPRSGEAERE